MMDAKHIILYLINDRSWVTKPVKWQLLLDIEEQYNIPRNVSEQIIKECLMEMLITINNEYLSITERGRKVLDGYETGWELTDEPETKHIKRKPNDNLNRIWIILVGAATVIAGIYAVISYHFPKSQENVNKDNHNTEQLDSNASKKQNDSIFHNQALLKNR